MEDESVLHEHMHPSTELLSDVLEDGRLRLPVEPDCAAARKGWEPAFNLALDAPTDTAHDRAISPIEPEASIGAPDEIEELPSGSLHPPRRTEGP